MVGVFREVRRVLRDDGTCWVNMGDSYNAGTSAKRKAPQTGVDVGGWQDAEIDGGARIRVAGLAPKQLLLMPARLALALQADGWFIRSDIIWHKPNPMPESCRDRPTSAHEHIFLLSKKRTYFYDADAVREDALPASTERMAAGFNGKDRDNNYRPGYFVRNGWQSTSRNLRNVWTIATAPYAEAHFATFPPLLAERCIRAGTSERGCCAACGAPWVRVTETTRTKDPTRHTGRAAVGCDDRRDGDWPRMIAASTTTGWAPSCACGTTTKHFGPFVPAEPVPCTVLDPFSGAGTTALVADRLGRDAIGIDLSHQYVEMTRERITADCPLFTSWAPAEDPEESRMADLFAEAAE